MTVAEVQRAALGPWRFSNMVEKHNSDLDAVNGDHDRGVLQPRTTVLLHSLPTTSRDECFLVPGGRYLVTATSTSLQLWDLGATAHISSASPRALSRVESDNGTELGVIIDLVVQQAHSDQLRIAILTMHGDILL
jgi:hypothetical protein